MYSKNLEIEDEKKKIHRADNNNKYTKNKELDKDHPKFVCLFVSFFCLFCFVCYIVTIKFDFLQRDCIHVNTV